MNNSILHYPDEYTNGSVFFYGKNFFVTPEVLIPRLETESLVREARQYLQKHPKNRVVDIGSGSGIIGSSLADLVDEVIFLEKSEAALYITKKNFLLHYPDKKVQFVVSDLLENIPIIPADTSILLVSNLPYIRLGDWENMSPDTKFEPKLALFGGEKTGFELYERLFLEIKNRGIGNNNFCMFFEFGFDQKNIAESVLESYPNWQYSFFADYFGIERFGKIESKV